MVAFGSYKEFKKDAEKNGYYINDDEEFVQALLDSISVNIDRYGYGNCPCRLASGKRAEDIDMICPCDYRDTDLSEYGACFCALYVSKEVLSGEKTLGSIPDRRMEELRKKAEESENPNPIGKLKVPIYRCKVCGYLCGKEQPPLQCPICKADSDRFEQLL